MQMITEVDVIVMFPPQIFIAFYRNMEYNLGEVVVRFVVPSGVTAQQTFQIKRVNDVECFSKRHGYLVFLSGSRP